MQCITTVHWHTPGCVLCVYIVSMQYWKWKFNYILVCMRWRHTVVSLCISVCVCVCVCVCVWWHCGAFQIPQKTNQLTTDFLLTWNLDQYNAGTAADSGTMQLTSYTSKLYLVLARHNNLAHTQIVHMLVSLLDLPNWFSMLGCY